MHYKVLRRFNNIPNIETYIIRRTSRYIRKVIRSEKNNIPWKLLGAWIFAPRKIGRPQNSCNNNFLVAICALIPEVKKNGKFQSWTPLAGEESSWNNKIDNFFAESRNPIPTTKPNMQNLRFDYYELVKLYYYYYRTTTGIGTKLLTLESHINGVAVMRSTKQKKSKLQ